LPYKQFFRSVLCCYLLLSTVQAGAENTSFFSVTGGGDDNGGSDYSVSLDLAVGGIQLGGMYAKNESEIDLEINNPALTSPIILNHTLRTYTREVSIGSDPSQELSVTWRYSWWGLSNKLEITTHRLELIYNTDDWRINLIPQRRSIDLHCKIHPIYYVSATLQALFPNLPQYCADNPVLDIVSDDITIGLSYYGADPWFMRVDYTWYNYDRNIAALPSAPPIFTLFFHLAFPPFAVQQTYALEDEHISLELGYAFDTTRIGIHGSRGVSVVDDSVSTSVSLYLNWQMDKHWTMDIEGGVSEHSLSSGEVYFGSVGLTYGW